MAQFEITGAGFDGNSDATDDSVLWVDAESEQQVQTAVEGTGANYLASHLIRPSGTEPWTEEDGLDYRLPRDAAALRTKLLYFQANAPQTTHYLNHYTCPCGESWESEDDSMCDDRCPRCDTSVTPHHE